MTKRKSPAKPIYLSVILPVYNEENNIFSQYMALKKALDKLGKPCEIIFVDDGSTDRSAEILNSIAKKDKTIKLVIFRRNFGQTAAMSAGIDHSSGEIIVLMDSDLQNDADDIALLVSKIEEGYDVVSGWRVSRKDGLFTRTIPSKIANWLIAKITGVKLHDLGCSLKAYTGNVLRQINLYGEMHRFIPVHASWIGARITEVPVKHYPREHGKSNYGIIRAVKVLLDLVTVKFMGSYSTKPIYVFGGTGMFLLFMSILSGSAVLIFKIFYDHNMVRNPLLLLTVMLIILSMLFIHIGILAEIAIRTYHESQHKPPYSIKEKVNIK